MISTRRLLLPLAAATALCGTAFAQTPAPTPLLRLRGTVDSVDGQTLHVTTRTGTHDVVAFQPSTPIGAVLPASLADIRQGVFIGTAATAQPDGTLKALEVSIFPEAMRGTGEGHYGWDLGQNTSMTNANVASVVGSSGRMLTLDYPGGEQHVQVPEGTPIVTFGPGSAAMLSAGAHVIVFAHKAADGSLQAARIMVGKDGLTPPM